MKMIADLNVDSNENKFIRATSSPSDPVGTIDGEWGFWDETWSEWTGGFATEADARAGVQKYIEEFLDS